MVVPEVRAVDCGEYPPFAAAAEVAQIIEPVTAGKPIVDVTNALNEHAGLAIGNPMKGVLAGTAIGAVLALLLWLVDRRR